MSRVHRAFAFLFLVLFIVSIASPLTFHENLVPYAYRDATFTPAATDYVVDIREYNNLLAFNDDDFEFTVLNGSTPLNNAWVRLYNISSGLLEYEEQTNGLGKAEIYNLPQGTYQWNVSHESDMVTPQATGQLVSDGPEANVVIQFGNLDWQNDNDDLQATITDIEGRPAENLNFSIHYAGNNSIWDQVEVIDGTATFYDLPIDNYTWEVRVFGDPIYNGYLLDEGTVESNGTQHLVDLNIGSFTGSPEFLDLEIFTYFETSLFPIVGATIEITFKNGTPYDSKTTPTNGTVLFVDLPVAFINLTITYMGQPVGLGDFFYDLTDIASDEIAPVITGPADLAVLIDAENVTLTWTVEDRYPSSIEVWIDGVLNVTTSWVNTTFDYVYNVSALFPAMLIDTYEIKLVAFDLNSNFAEDTVSLRIYENIPPVIEGPEPVEFTFTETGYSLSWNITDEFPNMYEVHLDDDLYAEGVIDPDEPVVSVSLDGLGVGVHNFTLYANDTSGNTATDSVLVTVLGDTIPPVISYTPPDVYYAQGDSHQTYNWTATDDFKDYYEILVDGVVIVSENWIESTITFDFSGLQQGTHNVTLRVYDLGGNMAESVVLVHVLQSTASYYLTSAALAAVAIILLIGIVWFVRYR